ncbi:MAG TPA: zinc ribbon domain-containing protein [Spongiibacteraceae bacterium]|nr:zinc ribbon domain-containing protein [Spongiibacteraceae bacterium]
MPIYEYQCDACGHHLEALQKISDAPLVECPECARPALRKCISAAGFRLKGGGWYETDFKSSAKRNLAGESAGGSANSGSGGDGGAPASGGGSGAAASASNAAATPGAAS